MSLAYLRDVYHKPFRPGAHVTVQSGFADPYPATIVGSVDVNYYATHQDAMDAAIAWTQQGELHMGRAAA